MSCVDNVCGTGLEGGNIPKPGDPDGSIVLSARQVYGGINVSWSWPTTNPHAVAYTSVYRGTNNVFAQSIEQAKVGGSLYFDSLDPPSDTEYYYWIQIRTVNGTLQDPIGPVSAIAKRRGYQTLETLTGLIDSGVLAQALKTEIAGIGTLGQDLMQEINTRIAGNEALSTAIAQIDAGLIDAFTYVNQEITQRTEGDNAIVTMVNELAAVNEGQIADLYERWQVLVDADQAMASQITQLFAQSSANQAAINNEAQVRATADSAQAQQTALLTAQVQTAQATIQQEQTARATADSALAQQINQTETTLNGNVAAVQTNLQTQINTTNGVVTNIGALYTAKVSVNGLIGGFGVYNNGTEVEAGFDVDRFWVGRTNDEKIKPFIIDNGVVYIDKARIREADIDTLKIKNNAVTQVLSATNTENDASCEISIPIVTTGAPLVISLSGTLMFDASGSSIWGSVQVLVYKDNVLVKTPASTGFAPSGSGNVPVTISYTFVDQPAAGNHTYKFVVQAGGAPTESIPFQSEITATLLEAKR